MIPWSESAFNNSEWIKCIRGNLLFDLHSLIIIFLRSRFPLQTNNKWMIWSADDAGSIKWMCGDPLHAPRKMRSSHLSGDMDQKGRRTPALSNHPFVPRQQKRIGLWWIIPAFRCLLLDISASSVISSEWVSAQSRLQDKDRPAGWIMESRVTWELSRLPDQYIFYDSICQRDAISVSVEVVVLWNCLLVAMDVHHSFLSPRRLVEDEDGCGGGVIMCNINSALGIEFNLLSFMGKLFNGKLNRPALEERTKNMTTNPTIISSVRGKWNGILFKTHL